MTKQWHENQRVDYWSKKATLVGAVLAGFFASWAFGSDYHKQFGKNEDVVDLHEEIIEAQVFQLSEDIIELEDKEIDEQHEGRDLKPAEKKKLNRLNKRYNLLIAKEIVKEATDT